MAKTEVVVIAAMVIIAVISDSSGVSGSDDGNGDIGDSTGRSGKHRKDMGEPRFSEMYNISAISYS